MDNNQSLPQLQLTELSYLLDVEETDFHGPQNQAIQQSDANFAEHWMNTPSLGGFNQLLPSLPQDQCDIFSDTESITSCGTAVPSPGIFRETEGRFSFNIDDEELKELSVKDLNVRLKGQRKDTVRAIKKRRRTLKNRGYAHSCRIKRLEEKSSLQKSSTEMQQTIATLEAQLRERTRERDQYKTCYEQLIRRIKQRQF